MKFLEKFGLLIIALVHLRIRCVDSCDNDEFQCDNGQCVSIERKCDGESHCSDASDESKCMRDNYPRCPEGYFQCISDGRCIRMRGLCDGYEECIDESDEKNCTKPHCKDYTYFECLNQQCIGRFDRCDGKTDCDDGSDELHCGLHRYYCKNLYFSCETDGLRCVLREKLCDGVEDCKDGSDENLCDVISLISTTPETITLETTGQSCPENYCRHHADCVVIKGQYYCHCSPLFSGETCEIRISAERYSHDLSMVIGIAMTLITLFIITGLMLFCYFKRRAARNSTALVPKNEGQIPFTSYSKE